MSDDDVTELLAELRGEIADASGLADDDRDRLEELVVRLEREADPDDDDDPGILDHVEEAVVRFETEHPTLTATINRIANLLSASGL